MANHSFHQGIFYEFICRLLIKPYAMKCAEQYMYQRSPPTAPTTPSRRPC